MPPLKLRGVDYCGNTEMFYLSLGKLSGKSYLSGQNPTCPVFCINI